MFVLDWQPVHPIPGHRRVEPARSRLDHDILAALVHALPSGCRHSHAGPSCIRISCGPCLRADAVVRRVSSQRCTQGLALARSPRSGTRSDRFSVPLIDFVRPASRLIVLRPQECAAASRRGGSGPRACPSRRMASARSFCRTRVRRARRGAGASKRNARESSDRGRSRRGSLPAARPRVR